jgi:hypothetical protein
MLHETMEKKFMLYKVISDYTKKIDVCLYGMSSWKGGVLAQAKRMANNFRMGEEAPYHLKHNLISIQFCLFRVRWIFMAKSSI